VKLTFLCGCYVYCYFYFSALKNTVVSGLILQFFALIILLIFFVPGAATYFDFFGALKNRYGFVYSFVATAVLCALFADYHITADCSISPCAP